MIVDSSALVAIVLREPGYDSLLDKLARSDHSGIGAPTALETAMVLAGRLDRDPGAIIHGLLREYEITEVAFGEAHRREAHRAAWRYGRGRHPAALNFGDCMTYAVASLAGEPLLFTGEDFRATDLLVA